MKNNKIVEKEKFCIKKWLKDNLTLSVFDIALFALFIALYFIADSVQRFALTGPRKIAITYTLFIIFGIVLGPIKGGILALLCDTVTQLIYGIQFWMIEYAIVPVLIAVLSSLIFKLRKFDSHWLWLIGFFIITFTTAIFVTIILLESDLIKWKETSRKAKPIASNVVTIVSSISIGCIWIFSISLALIHRFTKNENWKNNTTTIFIIFINTTVSMILFRWIWGPFSYINFHNRFFNKRGTWTYSDYYLIWMIPIIFKSLIEIPVYTFLTYSLYPVIRYMQNQYKIQNKAKY
ncbi:ECF transporter S component [Mycoplasma phocoenae]|uniref:ECF transporter S component n=1 Tax=Mycoplasma phocoenae TaxID=754517 RepID=A0A858U3W8_9MOLU|nr:ECF transporter S component [Mycoplasma phocoenae]QJG66749.1 ECF transporter S component [Mycoplasma phocoenae]